MSIERVAVVGAGFFAAFQLEAWQALGVEVAGICDTDATRAEAMARRFDIARTYADAAAMCDELQPALLDIVTPPAAHAALVGIALQRRIPTICQKPFGDDLRQAEAMSEQAQRLQVPLIVHENFRFTPWFRECRRLLDAGQIGRVHAISFRLRPGDGQGPRAYLDRQPYFQTMPRLLVRETAVHFVDTFRHLMGEVLAVTARLRRINPVIAGEDAGYVIFEFEDGSTGLFDGNRLNDHTAGNPRRTMGEMWLEGSLQNDWSVSQMRGKRWETLGTPPEDQQAAASLEATEADAEANTEANTEANAEDSESATDIAAAAAAKDAGLPVHAEATTFTWDGIFGAITSSVET